MVTYTLFAAPDTYAMGAHAVLEETGADYRVHWVTLSAEHPDPAFAVASPHGRVPALTGPEGAVFETGAVALYIAERHPEAGLVIAPGDPRRGRFLQWFHYLASTLQPEVLIQYHPEVHTPDPDRQRDLIAASHTRTAAIFAALDRAVGAGPYLFGAAPCVVDFLLAGQTLWDVLFPDGIDAYPGLARQRAAMVARPSMQAMLAEHRAEARRRG